MNDASPSPTQSGGEQARRAAAVASDHAGEVVATARDQARNVAHDARSHLDDVARTAQQRVNEQAGVASGRAADGLRTLADRFGALAAGDPGAAGPFAEYANDIRSRATQLADRLEDGPDAVLDDIRRFARRRPMVFLVGTGIAGFVAGRMVMGARDAEMQRDADQALAPTSPTAAPVGEVGVPSGGTLGSPVDRQGLPLSAGVPS